VGRIKVISRSKIRNKMEMMKYCVEKDIRFVDIVLNPHSNVEFLFLLGVDIMFIKLNVRIKIRIVMIVMLLMFIIII